MIWSFAQDAWHFIFGWAGIDMLVGFAAVAVAVFVPLLRKWAIHAAILAFTCMGLIAYGYSNGLKEKQAQWDVALAKEAAQGETARTDAESAVRNELPASVRNDPRNRDNWQHAGKPPSPVRRLAGYRFFLRSGQR